MDEPLKYTSDEDLIETPSLWNIARTVSATSESSKIFLQYQNYHLHFIHNKEVLKERPTLPSSRQERLAFYRTYLVTPNKAQMIYMEHRNFNRFFWNFIMNTMFTSIPHTFVHLFLSCYAPENHLFVSKMVPFFWGSKITIIVASLFEVTGYGSKMSLLLLFIFNGFYYKGPWNRCPEGGFRYKNDTVNCYELEEFGNKIRLNTTSFQTSYYMTDSGEKFQLAQLEYFRNWNLNRSTWVHYISTLILWLMITVIMLRKLPYKKHFWKVMNAFHLALLAFDFSLFMYLTILYLGEGDFPMPVQSTETISKALELYLTIKPTMDSALIVLSNSVYYIFIGMLAHRVRKHCENVVKAELHHSIHDSLSWILYWPLCFSTFRFGDVFTILFLILNFGLDFFILIITYQCHIEAITWEWKFVKPWMILFTQMVFCTVYYFGLTEIDQAFLTVNARGIVTMVEILGIYWLYPTGRLIDDITFHYGVAPPTLRIISLKLVPIFYCIRFYVCFETWYRITSLYLIDSSAKQAFVAMWSWLLFTLPVLFGMLYTIYIFMFKWKKKWIQMFIPYKDWGPLDNAIKNLRKEYSSSTYIGSQAPRALSRYIIERSEAKTFKLDVKYDLFRRSTNPATIRVENDKKYA